MRHGKKLVLVIDCGATSVRAAAVDERGRIVHIQALPNAARPQRADRPWLVWDIEDIWKKTLSCAAAVVRGTGRERFAAISVVTFSDDGAPFDRGGRMLYPVISWHCPRTAALAESVRTRSDFASIFRLCGEQPLHQHTLMRLLWLREHEPRVYEARSPLPDAPGNHTHERLTGTAVNDPTTADSMMLMDIRKRRLQRRSDENIRDRSRIFPPRSWSRGPLRAGCYRPSRTRSASPGRSPWSPRDTTRSSRSTVPAAPPARPYSAPVHGRYSLHARPGLLQARRSARARE
ncbi:MAG: FGGY family carbohydrate kinase [Spirochaetota bacterium]